MEIIVSDVGSSDGALDLVSEDVVLVRPPRGQAIQMNHDATGAHGVVPSYCHADIEPPAGWREAVLAAPARAEVSGAAFATLVVPALAILHVITRLRLPTDSRIMLGDVAQFMRQEILDRVGGFPTFC